MEMTQGYDDDYPGKFGWPYWNQLFYWLGPTQIPPLPSWIGMTDRVTGVTWWLILAPDFGHLSLTTQTPVGPQRVFGPWDGPFIGQFGFRIGVSNGHLNFDAFPEQGAGPFAASMVNKQNIAGLLMFASKTPSRYDHLLFIVGSATNSIFDPSKPLFTDQFPWGNTSDVLT
jgi:hypothetical protein